MFGVRFLVWVLTRVMVCGLKINIPQHYRSKARLERATEAAKASGMFPLWVELEGSFQMASHFLHVLEQRSTYEERSRGPKIRDTIGTHGLR